MSAALLRLFVYGTLKRGFGNHDRFCQNARSIVEARVIGRIYELPAGYPAIVIPDAHILACGTADPDADAATQQRAQTEWEAKANNSGNEPPGRDWGWVNGELLTFEDAARQLPAIDELEGFSAGRPSHYDRVLAFATLTASDERVVCWIYVMKDPGPGARLLPDGRWPG